MPSLSWIDVAHRLQSLAQTGLTYAQDGYDRERYQEIAEMSASMLAGPEPERVRIAAELFALERGYATPKVDVRAAVFQDGRLLLVREREDGGWTLPGGWADVGLSPAACVVKETREEAGLIVTVRKLLAVWDRNQHPHPPHPFHIYKLVFHCDIAGGAPAAGIETSDVGFFAEDQIPPLSLTRILPGQVRRIFEHARHPDWPADFD